MIFIMNILRKFKIINSVKYSNQSISIISRNACIFHSNFKELHIQFPNHQHAVNLSENYGKRSQIFIRFKYLRLIKNSIRDFGAAVELNSKFAHALENAKKNNVPQEFIEFAVKISCDNRANVGLYDLRLPNGCHFLIQYDDVDSILTRYHLLRLCEKFDGTLFQGKTIWPESFNQKGLVLVKSVKSDPLSSIPKETFLKFGVETFQKEPDVEGIEYWKFYCDPWQLCEVKQKIYEITEDVEEAYVTFLPKRKVKLAKHIRSSVFNVFHKLCEVPTIDHVYINFDFN